MQRSLTYVVTLAFLALAGCDGDSGPTDGNGNLEPTSMVAVSGGNQRIIVDGTLMQPFVVEVRDQNGDGLAGVTVEWAVTAGGGTLSASSSTTGSDGRASVTLTAGSSEGTSTVTASVAEVSTSVAFTATAVAPAMISINSGNNQTARTGVPLADPLSVTVTASDAGPVPGATVDWMVTTGGGSLEQASTTTGINGMASNDLTLGSAVGTHTVEASVGASLTTEFTADATDPVTVTVDMEGIAFVSSDGDDVVTIQLGDGVRWVNQDGVEHTATSNSTPAGGASFDSDLLSTGGEFTFVPDTRGEWIYFCEVHPTRMAGARIIVQ
ncbi:MAG: hypothetical protein GWN99_09740 [Gemmatimonadetes bacterium]|uniref:Big-1 domain-containing protein n=1 Tax=Candidatus Kutchimonas denitrificans TaxID=3056748 RepID=A0AAE4Z6B6_9BACT|nr:hypothetical protein [Gemmatimonadota bacterium]NIR74149.1 hypothetical protein [Candidatus Kutchimonas denitrificans]NIS01331.1 hypothetical protein [Gemmatimonadota bacterium]NIT67062.1 hypothetical protein [Gemmatimonadota bacterium]NIU51722.1 hypothetical protein [Gemmatimonadota bacterium]